MLFRLCVMVERKLIFILNEQNKIKTGVNILIGIRSFGSKAK